MDTLELYQKFTGLVNNYKERIQESKRARKEIAQKAKGNPGYNDDHIKWLGGSASKVLTCLKVIAREYNENHPNKAITNQDLVDILETALLVLKRG